MDPLRAEWIITIPGAAATKGSMKCIGRRGKRAHVLVEDHESSDPWRKTVSGWLTRKRGDVAAPKGQPLGVEITFTLKRPKSHYRARRNRTTGVTEPTGVLKPTSPTHPVGQDTGDLDKLVRLVADAMQDAGLIHNDSAICELTARKAYPVPGDRPDPYDRLPYPGVRIRLYPLDTAGPVQ